MYLRCNDSRYVLNAFIWTVFIFSLESKILHSGWIVGSSVNSMHQLIAAHFYLWQYIGSNTTWWLFGLFFWKDMFEGWFRWFINIYCVLSANECDPLWFIAHTFNVSRAIFLVGVVVILYNFCIVVYIKFIK